MLSLKVAILVAFVAVASASGEHGYEYKYDVSDPHTGDHKSAFETRRGDLVQGSYSVLDADGTTRTVDYTADGLHGFNAVVRKEGLAAVAVPAPIVAPAPIVRAEVAAPYVAAPAPILRSEVASPVLSYAAAPSPIVRSYASPALHGYTANGYSGLGWGLDAYGSSRFLGGAGLGRFGGHLGYSGYSSGLW